MGGPVVHHTAVVDDVYACGGGQEGKAREGEDV